MIFQIAAAISAVMIKHFYQQSQKKILQAEWSDAYSIRKKTFCLRIIFFLLALYVLVLLIIQIFIQSKGTSTTGISAILVSILVVTWQKSEEAFPLSLLEIMKANKMENFVKGSSTCILKHIGESYIMKMSRYLHCYRRDLNYLFEITPLGVNIDDYQLLGRALGHSEWRIVTACEKSQQEITELIASNSKEFAIGCSRHGTEPDEDIEESILHIYCKLIAELDNPGSDDIESLPWSSHYHQLLESNESITGEYGKNCYIQVILQDLYGSKEVQCQLRKWDDSFRLDVEIMRSACPTQSSYTDTITELFKARSNYDLMEKTSSWNGEVDMPTVFLLFALEGKYNDRHNIRDVNKMRQVFLVEVYRCLMRIGGSKKTIKTICEVENLSDLVNAVTLLFIHWASIHGPRCI